MLCGDALGRQCARRGGARCDSRRRGWRCEWLARRDSAVGGLARGTRVAGALAGRLPAGHISPGRASCARRGRLEPVWSAERDAHAACGTRRRDRAHCDQGQVAGVVWVDVRPGVGHWAHSERMAAWMDLKWTRVALGRSIWRTRPWRGTRLRPRRPDRRQQRMHSGNMRRAGEDRLRAGPGARGEGP